METQTTTADADVQARSSRTSTSAALSSTSDQLNPETWAPGEYPWPAYPTSITAMVMVADGRAVRQGDRIRILDAAKRVARQQELAEDEIKRQSDTRREFRRRAVEAAQRHWQRSGVPAMHRVADLRRVDVQIPQYAAAVNQVKRLLAEPMLAALVGVRGNGKTYIGCGLVREFCRSGRSAKYLRAMDFLRQLRATWTAKRGQENEDDLVDSLAGVDLLVIDEVQERSGSDWERAQLTNLIDIRFAGLRPTLLIGNVEPRQLAPQLGDSIASRLQSGLIIPATWASFRAAGKATAPTIGPEEWPACLDEEEVTA